MLKEHEKHVAYTLSMELLEEGMLFGEELEWYLKLSINGKVKLDEADKYFEFEDYVLKCIERRTRYLRVLDTKKNKEHKFNTVGEFAKKVGVTNARVLSALRGQNLMMKRYRIWYENTPVKELIKC